MANRFVDEFTTPARGGGRGVAAFSYLDPFPILKTLGCFQLKLSIMSVALGHVNLSAFVFDFWRCSRFWRSVGKMSASSKRDLIKWRLHES